MDIRKQIKLDIISIKPYFTLKNLFIFTVIPLVYMLIMNSPNVMVSMSLIIAMIFSSYPFLVGDNSGIDGLYRIFGIYSRDVVIGRYILAAIIYLVTSIFIFAIYLVISFIRKLSIDITLLANFGINFVVYTIITSLQYPIFFKHGYTKAKSLALVPLFVIGILGMLVGFFVDDFTWIINFAYVHKTTLIITFTILVILIIVISIKLAIKFYKKRDF